MTEKGQSLSWPVTASTGVNGLRSEFSQTSLCVKALILFFFEQALQMLKEHPTYKDDEEIRGKCKCY